MRRILISGPTGAGKSRLARWCHERSNRGAEPFETLDLMTVPEELQMAELFGWKKGAFTGAVRTTRAAWRGRRAARCSSTRSTSCRSRRRRACCTCWRSAPTVRWARPGERHGGRALHHRHQRGPARGGARRAASARTSTTASTCCRCAVPPLDERQDEIPLWARYMVVRRHRERLPEGEARLAPEAERRLSGQPWPGNLRQLDNIVRRAYTLAMVGARRGATGELDAAGAPRRAGAGLRAGGRGSRPVPEAPAGPRRGLRRTRRGSADAPLDLDLADALPGLRAGRWPSSRWAARRPSGWWAARAW